jgi:tetratricopeptide (TPR) repeat protein
VPVALLAERLHIAESEAGSAGMAMAARDQAEALAESYASAGGNATLAAALLASLGGHAHARFQDGLAARLYQRALRLEPGQPAALLGLAAVEEKLGRTVEAAALLDRVLTLEPESREARLRRALVRDRLGEPHQAEEELRDLLTAGGAAERGGDWITAIAYQERARILAQRGQLEEARALAAEGLAILPCDPVLPVLLAFYQERLGTPGDTLSRHLAECAGALQVSPRVLYNRNPQGVFASLRRELRDAERRRLPLLERALDGSAGR